ncbi:MAG: glycoside hydrolase family 127 protein [Clostridia bacterium]|nr:glycoside hydrolase family 127 protein [Clostridia bacterium]
MFPDRCEINGVFSDYLEIITKRQLLDRELWKKCVEVFSSGIDDNDRGWRGEYWGKMMRGACLVYRVTRNEELYSVLTGAVEGLLSKQEPSGRISTYSVEKEFYGWDLWARKYVMTGLEHYLDVCRDEELKKRILKALCAHADYITGHIGENKIPILETGLIWGSVNSASILEPFVRLYNDTKNEEYLSFAKYIISTGGCSDGNLIDCVFEGKAPFEFPEQKAYETMSFFEGLLAYYETTGEKYLLDAVIKFVDRLLETDFTAIGSCGCTHELFDNSSLRQTEPSEKIMQETCVTVTLMRLLSRLFAVTGDKKLFDAIRKSALNALAGALNVNGYKQYSGEKKEYLPGMLFDSYSPVCGGARGKGIGGFKQFADGTYFGCCACIASAGFALYPLMCVTENNNEIRVNDAQEGEYVFLVPEGEIRLLISPTEITVSAPEEKMFTLCVSVGIPSKKVFCLKNGEEGLIQGGYAFFTNVRNSDRISLKTENRLVEESINGKLSLSYAGFTLAVDESKTDAYVPGEKTVFEKDENGRVLLERLPAGKGEQLRFSARTDRGEILLTDYASAGQDGSSRVSVWF